MLRTIASIIYDIYKGKYDINYWLDGFLECRLLLGYYFMSMTIVKLWSSINIFIIVLNR